MKLLPLLVVIFGVYTVDCLVFPTLPGEPDGHVWPTLPSEPGGHDSTARPEGHDSTARPEGHEPAAKPDGHDSAARPEGHDSAARPEGHEPADISELHISADRPESDTSDIFDKKGMSLRTSCPADQFTWNPYIDYCTKLFTDRTRNWYQAKQKCESEGMTMVSIWLHYVPDTTRFLREKLHQYGKHAWVNAKDIDGKGFKWQYGSWKPELSYGDNNYYWYPGAPRRSASQNCMLMLNFSETPYYATDCNYPYLYALCEKW